MRSVRVFLGIVSLIGMSMLIGCAESYFAEYNEDPPKLSRPSSSQVLLKKCERIEEINERKQRTTDGPYQWWK